jgi:hypothetical protein
MIKKKQPATWKYSIEERQIVREIWKLKHQQRDLRNKYLEIDCKVSALKAKLGGKYGTRKI